jgi:HEAT repeat protein
VNTKKKIMYAFVFCIVQSVFSQSQDPVVLSYQRNFIRASITTKIELLNDASRITSVSMTPLYIDALQFVETNYKILGSDTHLLEIAFSAVSKISQWSDPSALIAVKSIFTLIPDSKIRSAAISSILELDGNANDTVLFLNNWFASEITKKNMVLDVDTLTICANALGEIASPTSFPILFTAISSPLDSRVIEASRKAINKIDDNYITNILAIITSNDIQQVYTAFSLAMTKETLSDSEKGTVAHAAFSRAIEHGETNSKQVLPLISESLEILSLYSWAPSSESVVKYFYKIQSDYKAGKASTDVFIAVIKTLGFMGTTEAAQALSIYLGLLNSETEQKKTYNEQIMLSVIDSLGNLGDKTAFDYLLYVGYLDYPESVIKASREALARLKW